jgi:hypothetical protein
MVLDYWPQVGGRAFAILPPGHCGEGLVTTMADKDAQARRLASCLRIARRPKFNRGPRRVETSYTTSEAWRLAKSTLPDPLAGTCSTVAL